MKTLISLLLASILWSCSTDGPEPIRLHKDNCDFCRMSIADGHFGAELITIKGRVYKFDDLSCLIRYKAENPKLKFSGEYVHDFPADNVLIPVAEAFFVQSEQFRSPMRGDVAAFSDKAKAEAKATEYGTGVLDWAKLSQ
jgi:copper chaperone NosL